MHYCLHNPIMKDVQAIQLMVGLADWLNYSLFVLAYSVCHVSSIVVVYLYHYPADL